MRAGKAAAAGSCQAGLPLSERIRHVDAQKDDRRELKLFPAEGVEPAAACCLRMMAKAGVTRVASAVGRWEMVCDSASINLKVNARDYRPAWKALKVSLPAGNPRLLVMVKKERVAGPGADKAQQRPPGHSTTLFFARGILRAAPGAALNALPGGSSPIAVR